MNKYVLLLLMIMAAVVYNFQDFVGGTRSSNILRVGVECDHVPYNWQEDIASESNFPLKDMPGFYAEGYDVQMAALIANELGMTIEFRKISFDELIPALNRNEIDAIFSGMVDTEERRAFISFTKPYQDRPVEYAILVHRKSRYANAWRLKDFSGARIAAQKGSRFDTVIDQIEGVQHMTPLESQAAILVELSELKIDGTVVNYDSALSYERTHPDFRAIRFQKDEGL